jgi:pyruvate/2-oxoglutarate dehydrogenase complex dihydrolipoamide dehydrogenase (E3) component
LVGRHLVISAGARHAPLAIPGEEHLTTRTEFLDLEQLPRRVAFVGGGYIAFEFAQIAARAGAEYRFSTAATVRWSDSTLISLLNSSTSHSI